MTDSNRSEIGEFPVYTAEGVNDALAAAVRRAAEPLNAGELISQQIDRAARRLRLPRNQVKRLWYREMNTVPAHIALTVLAFDRRTAAAREEIARLQAELDSFK